MTPELEPIEPASTPAEPRRLGWVLAVVAVAAVVGGSLLWWLTSDPAGDLENEFIEAFDAQFERVNDPSWCERGCSATGHEWHIDRDIEFVTAEIVRIAERAGIEALNESVSASAGLVRLGRGDAVLEVGVTGPEWPLATSEATGTAVWFTSVALFDVDQSEPAGDTS